MELNDRLRELLTAEGLTQARLAKQLNLSSPTVSPWFQPNSTCDERYLARIVSDSLTSLSADAKTRLLAELLLLRLRRRVKREDLEHQLDAWKLFERANEELTAQLPSNREPKRTNRTLADFPHAFEPLAVVTGDKREDSESRINAADFGAVSASPAETRWVSRLRFSPDVEFFTDKVVMLEPIEELRRRFGKRNLLVVGSPGSNHLARRIHWPRPGWRAGVPLFRFNIPPYVHVDVEEFLLTLAGLNRKQLVGKQGDPTTARKIKQWLGFFFQGGIFCPTGGDELRALFIPQNRDFGVITLARNPFAESDDFVAILVAGFHLMGTAHAVRMLADPENFRDHPYGGVVRVDIDLGKGFAKRFDESSCEWDTRSGYSASQILTDLNRLVKNGSRLAPSIEQREFKGCVEFLEAL